MQFKDYSLTHKVPLTIYCDFESFVEPLEAGDEADVVVDPDVPSTAPHPTTTTQKKTINSARHTPSGFCYVIVNCEGRVIKEPTVYTGPNVVDTFLTKLMTEAEILAPYLQLVQPIRMTAQDNDDFDNATDCHLCNKPLNGDKVRNHNHLTGEFLGAAHNQCNLSYKVPQHIPVFFHNLKGYDCHHLMQGFGKYKEEKMSCIAKNSEQYISVSLESLRFLDSLQFLSCSLEKLVNNLAADGPARFSVLKQCMGDQHLNLLLRKGVFPYSWLTDATKLQATQLPPRAAFFNDLTQEVVTEEDYRHAQTVWETFNMSTMQEYHDLYLKTDVLLLADVFENFRTTAMQYYGVDPCNVYSAPGLAWKGMLKMTGVRLELLTDIDQHLFVEKGIRGGVAMISHRYAKPNNPLLPDYDPTTATTYLLDLDCNNLYGTAMMQPLPQADFRWLSPEEISELDILTVSDDADTGYILEVDLHYPEHLHDRHSDYPLAPERRLVTEEMLSPYSKQLLKDLGMKMGKTPKLLTTLDDKEGYVVHYRTLKLYLQLGLELRSVHKVLAFTQSAWLAPFIQFNTDKRKAARNEFEKDFFKLMNNSTYGKSLENVRSHTDFKLVANERQLIKLSASPRLKTFFAFNEDLAGLSMKKQTIHLNRPVYVGLAVLDISKMIMYDFHYNWAVRKYGEDATMIMTDTDSLFYYVKTKNVYEDMKADLDLFDTSNYPTDHPNYSAANMKALGKFKDEFGGKPPKEWVGLRAKCYSAVEHDGKEKKVAKGVPRAAIKKDLKHELYKQCLFNKTTTNTTSNTINSKLHKIYTQKVTKLSLSPYDDKRYILPDGIHTLAHGHYRIRQTNSPHTPPLTTSRKRPAPSGDPPPPKRHQTSSLKRKLDELSSPPWMRAGPSSSSSTLQRLKTVLTSRAPPQPAVIDLTSDEED